MFDENSLILIKRTMLKIAKKCAYSRLADTRREGTIRAFASVQSCKIFVIFVIVIVKEGKQSQILLRKLCTKSYFVGFAQK